MRESAWKRTKKYFRRMRANKAGGWIALLLLLLLDKNVEASTIDDTIDYRLPNKTIPISYDIKLIPHIIENNFTYNGNITIDIKVINETSSIILHAHEGLKIIETSTYLIYSNGTIIKPKCHERINTTDFLKIYFDNKIQPGFYKLKFSFIGNISKEPIGIYRSSYINDKNDKVYIVATHLSPIKARRAFPCWDEPAFKATFNLSINHFPNYTATSNMPVKNKSLIENDKIWTTFETTPPISTYIFAFVISNFDCLKNDNATFNICARKNIISQMKYIKEVGDKAFPHLAEYTGIPYSLPKLDNFAIIDAKSNMENYGLIIYRESNVVIDNETTCAAKEATAELVIHELSHQWFGNLVSPAWWKYLWLKEGLARYFQFYIGNKVYPDWDLMNMFVVRILQTSAFTMDSTTQYNYLNWEPKSPTEIKSQFSSMTYHKGAVIMHMLNNILSEEIFQQGIRIYLQKHKNGVATSDDFWKAMQEAYNKTNKKPSICVKSLMKPWTEQKGYPIIKVNRNYTIGTVLINQTCNLLSEQSNRWCVPINYATKTNLNFNKTQPINWLKPHDVNLSIDAIDKNDWIILNVQQSGYYRVDYDLENWKKITEYLNSDNYTNIHVLNRGQLINDLSYFAQNDLKNYTTFLELTKYLSREIDLIPWRHATIAFRSIKRKIIDKEFQDNLNKYVLSLMKKLSAEIGYEEKPTDSYILKKKRIEFLPFLCEFNHTECKKIAEKKLSAYIENSTANPISPNLESWIFCSGVSAGENKNMLSKKIENGEYKYFKYLGCLKNKTYLREYIDKALVNSTLPKNNTRMALGFISNDGPENWDYAVDYFTKNFDQITKYFNNTTFTSSTLNDYIWRTPSRTHMKKISDFVDQNYDHLTPWVKTAIPQQLKKLEWSQKNSPVLNEWLKKQIATMEMIKAS